MFRRTAGPSLNTLGLVLFHVGHTIFGFIPVLSLVVHNVFRVHRISDDLEATKAFSSLFGWSLLLSYFGLSYQYPEVDGQPDMAALVDEFQSTFMPILSELIILSQAFTLLVFSWPAVWAWSHKSHKSPLCFWNIILCFVALDVFCVSLLYIVNHFIGTWFLEDNLALFFSSRNLDNWISVAVGVIAYYNIFSCLDLRNLHWFLLGSLLLFVGLGLGSVVNILITLAYPQVGVFLSLV